jgi:hypothetical protein
MSQPATDSQRAPTGANGHSAIDRSGQPPAGRALLVGTILIVVVAAFLCCIPEPGLDLFWQLRTGQDILRTGHVPRVDTYSWSNYGRVWIAPEWLSFVFFNRAYRAGAFFATWLAMVLIMAATALALWHSLLRRVSPAFAFVLTNVALVEMAVYIQERPYLFTYLLLAVSVALILAARNGRQRLLLWLPPLCVLWTNLHQGVLVIAGVLLAYAAGDALSAAPSARNPAPERGTHLRNAKWMAGTAVACLVAGMASPYGWRVYWNVYVTMSDQTAMRVPEWMPVTTEPPAMVIGYFAWVSAIVFGFLWTRRPRGLGELFAVAGLGVESYLHLRNVPLFMIGGVLIAAPHIESVWNRICGRLRRPSRTAVRILAVVLAIGYLGAVARVSITDLKRWIGPDGYSPEGVGEAVICYPSFPERACDFIDREGFPANLKLYNSYSIGGFLIFRLPSEPVFIDGRGDVHGGRVEDDYTAMLHAQTLSDHAAIAMQYPFDCVITTEGHEAEAFALEPGWQIVYAEPPATPGRCFVFLKQEPRLAALIARCQQDCGYLRQSGLVSGQPGGKP